MSSKKTSPKTQTKTEAPPRPAGAYRWLSLSEQAQLDAPPPTVALNIDGELLELAARGDEGDLRAAFKIFSEMRPEEIRLVRRAIFRLEDWADSYLIGNGR